MALIKRIRRGGYELKLEDGERQLLRSLASQLRELLGTDDPSLKRLFPTAYPDDPERDREYQQLVRDDLVDRRLAALDIVEAIGGETKITEEQLAALMGAINDVRLVLGTQLDVSEDTDYTALDPSDPTAPVHGLYLWLGWLLEQAVDAASGRLPRQRDG